MYLYYIQNSVSILYSTEEVDVGKNRLSTRENIITFSSNTKPDEGARGLVRVRGVGGWVVERMQVPEKTNE